MISEKESEIYMILIYTVPYYDIIYGVPCQVKVSLAAVGAIKKDLDESQLQEVVTEIVVGALRGINVHLNLSQYPTCPRLWREPPQLGFSSPIHYDSVVSN